MSNVGTCARDDAEGEGDLAALAERVHAEPRQIGRLVGGVELAGLVERSDAPRSGRCDRVQHVLERLRRERHLAGKRRQVAVDAHDGRLRRFEVNVARVQLDGG